MHKDPKHGNQGQGNGEPDSMDDHSGWGEADEDTKQMAKERMRQAVEDAVKECKTVVKVGALSVLVCKRRLSI